MGDRKRVAGTARDPIVLSWQRHNAIMVGLAAAIPPKALGSRPLESRGRTVAEQFAHVNTVRLGWLQYYRTGRRPTLEEIGVPAANRRALVTALKQSGADVASFLDDALAGRARVRMFGGDVVRWYSYLVSHESHHRGQVALALKQSGHRLPESVSMKLLWQRWIFGA